MPTDVKRAMVAELAEAFSASRASIVADYRGLSVADIGSVRRALREQGIVYRVVKNRLARIAAEQAGMAELAPLLDGPCSIALSSDDEALLARTFLDAIRPFRSVAVHGGLIGGRRIDAEAVTRLASLPAREVMLAQLAGGIASPLATMGGLLRAPLQSLAGGLAQLLEQKRPAKQGGTGS